MIEEIKINVEIEKGKRVMEGYESAAKEVFGEDEFYIKEDNLYKKDNKYYYYLCDEIYNNYYGGKSGYIVLLEADEIDEIVYYFKNKLKEKLEEALINKEMILNNLPTEVLKAEYPIDFYRYDADNIHSYNLYDIFYEKPENIKIGTEGSYSYGEDFTIHFKITEIDGDIVCNKDDDDYKDNYNKITVEIIDIEII